MAKTQEELNALKEEVETLNKKLVKLTDEELAVVTGGDVSGADIAGNCAVSDIRPNGIEYPDHKDIHPVGIPEVSPVQSGNTEQITR